jgi:hypothetical protein
MPPTTLPAPDHDPDGLKLMASLRARIGGGSTDPRAEHYKPLLAAVQALFNKRRDTGAPRAELQRLESLQRDLQALARGL